MPEPTKKYQIIYADPPWSYRDKALAGNRGAGCKYPTQSREWLETLNVKDIADDNCILFLWVTMPKLNECFSLIEAWGFTYKTVAFTWIKKNKGGLETFGVWVVGREQMQKFVYLPQKENQREFRHRFIRSLNLPYKPTARSHPKCVSVY